jgi:hypothetical protein
MKLKHLALLLLAAVSIAFAMDICQSRANDRYFAERIEADNAAE